MVQPFEDPRKADMRDRCSIAVDAAGHDEIVEPALITMPPDWERQGAIVGDLQSVDSEGLTYAYYLRPDATKALPQWLGTLATAAQALDSIRLYIVVLEVTSVVERTCRSYGAGLLRLTPENTFERVLDPMDIVAAKREADFDAQVKALRDALRKKLDLNLDLAKDALPKVQEATRGMPGKARDSYIDAVEQREVRWRDWSDRVSERLDEAAAMRDEAGLAAVERMIEDGAVLDEDDLDSEGT